MKISARRVIAITTAVSCHLALLGVMLMPVGYTPDIARMPSGPEQSLELRFVPKTHELPRPPTPAPIVPTGKKDARSHVPARQVSNGTPPTAPPSPDKTFVPATSSGTPPAMGDGGFAERLRDAQGSNVVRGVPGSDVRLAPGIQLIDPMNQGVGAAIRNTQRLFGVTDSHCQDVEVWGHLSSEELIARHLTPSDVKRVNEKYHCGSPLGFSF